ncbi:MAG: cytochrome P460 family protein, partial [Desulfosarcina sp.]
MYPGTSPHGAFLKLYVNESAYEAAKDKKPMPDGAIIVKENYGKDKQKLMAVTPMYKMEGYNPDAGDWFWAKYVSKEPVEIAASGKVQSCIDCHTTQKDFLFTDSEPK